MRSAPKRGPGRSAGSSRDGVRRGRHPALVAGRTFGEDPPGFGCEEVVGSDRGVVTTDEAQQPPERLKAGEEIWSDLEPVDDQREVVVEPESHLPLRGEVGEAKVEGLADVAI